MHHMRYRSGYDIQHGAVYDVKNLYIADMSVAPITVRWPNGINYVIAEKIASDILAAYS